MEELGVNLIQLISYSLVFFLLFLITRRYISRLFEVVESRKKIIEEGIRNAEISAQILSEKEQEGQRAYERKVKEALDEYERIISEARAKYDRIIEEGEVRRKQILDSAQQELDDMRLVAREEGFAMAADIISLAIKKTFQELDIPPEIEEKYIKHTLNKLVND